MALDLEELEKQYHIIKAKGVRKDLKNIDALRKLDEDIETGVTALVDDDAGAIVAFLLARGDFSEEEAGEWVKKAEKEGVNLSLQIGIGRSTSAVVQPRPSVLEQISAAALNLLRAIPRSAIPASIDDLDFTTITYLLTRAIEEQAEGADWDDYPWVVDIFSEYVVVQRKDDLYKVPYTIDEMNQVTLGEFEKVRKQYVPLPAAQAASIDTPPEPHQGSEFIMHLRDVPESFSAEADEEGRELIWKEIFRVSTTFRPGTGEAVVIEQDMVDGLYESWGKALDFVPLTATSHYHEYRGVVPARDTDGELANLVQQEGSLYGGLWVPDEALRRKILDDKTIRDVSIYAMPDFFDRRTGQRWPWVIMHLLLTNYPQVVGMEPFGVEPTPIAASLDAEFTRYLEESLMAEQQNNINTPPESTLSEADRAALSQIRELQAQGFTLEGLVEQRRTLQQQARDLEIQAIVAAMEGRAAREDVTAIEGHRHYPAVIAAVEGALRAKGNEAFAASVSQTGHSPLDGLVLSVVNALPAEARMALGEAPRAPRGMRAGQETEPPQPAHRTEPIAADAQITDQMLEQFERELGMSPVGASSETEE